MKGKLQRITRLTPNVCPACSEGQNDSELLEARGLGGNKLL